MSDLVTLLLAATDPPFEAVQFGGFQLVSTMTCTRFQTETGIDE